MRPTCLTQTTRAQRLARIRISCKSGVIVTTSISKYLIRACLRIGLLAAGPTGLCLARIACAAGGAPDALQFWPQWRGPLAFGAAPLADPPLTWSETEHVKWKARIPGYGTSTPIVWGVRVFSVSAVSTGKKTARNKVADKTEASLALAGKELFIRGHECLYRAEE